MPEHVFKSWSRLLLCLALSGFGTTASAEGVSIRQLGTDQLRLATVAYRLGAANAGACSKPQMLTGLILHDLTQYRLDLRPAVASAFSVHGGIGVLEVVRGSVADRAGFAVDDEILEVNGASLVDPAAIAQKAQSSLRMERSAAFIAGALQHGTATVVIRRAGQLRSIQLGGQPGCGGAPFLISSSALNAWSDGNRIFVSNAMMRLAHDDAELAFVVAHEMAHNILGHASHGANRGLLGLFGVGAASVRREERQADDYAVSVMEHGGYRPEAAVEMLASLRRLLWWNVSLDHPGFGQRIGAVRAAIASRPPAPELALAGPATRPPLRP